MALTNPYYNTELSTQPYYNYFLNTEDGTHVTLGGHDVRIYLASADGSTVEIGRAQSLTAQRDFGVESVYELGSIKPQEFVPTRYSGSITLNRYLIRYDELVEAITKAGAPVSYSKEGRILLHSVKGIVIKVWDRYIPDSKGKRQIIREYRNCVISNCNEEFRAGALCGESMTLLYSECITPADSE